MMANRKQFRSENTEVAGIGADNITGLAESPSADCGQGQKYFNNDNSALHKTEPARDVYGKCNSLKLMEQDKMTTPGAAKIMGISESNLRKIIGRGEIPYVRVGQKKLLLARDIEAYLQGHYVQIPSIKTHNYVQKLPNEVANSRHLRKG